MSDTVLTGTAVQEVAGLAREGMIPQIIKVGDYEFSRGALARVDTDPELPAAVEFYTLDGFAAFLLSEGGEPPLVHVVTPVLVEALGPLCGQDKHLRPKFARAVCKNVTTLRFNTEMDLDALNIALQTCFEPGVGEVDGLRRFCASVKSSAEVGVADDGVSQTVQAKRGIAAIQTTRVSNPWTLAPWRTFIEIKQPQSTYVLRFLEGVDQPRVALYETGDTRWQVEAVKAIATYLRGQLTTHFTVLG
jgi:hypothetical protein